MLPLIRCLTCLTFSLRRNSTVCPLYITWTALVQVDIGSSWHCTFVTRTCKTVKSSKLLTYMLAWNIGYPMHYNLQIVNVMDRRAWYVRFTGTVITKLVCSFLLKGQVLASTNSTVIHASHLCTILFTKPCHHLEAVENL